MAKFKHSEDLPNYDIAAEALQAAHNACFNHPERDVLGMSNGPFSGTNEALGIIYSLETENKRLKAIIKLVQKILSKEINNDNAFD